MCEVCSTISAQDPSCTGGEGHSMDVYSLGVVLYELLVGHGLATQLLGAGVAQRRGIKPRGGVLGRRKKQLCQNPAA
jgi:hypothetical protein